MAPSAELAEQVRSSLSRGLGLEYGVVLIGDRFAREALRSMHDSLIDEETFRMLMLGLPRLADEEWLELVSGLDGDQPPYATLFTEAMRPVLDAVLDPSPQTAAQGVEEDLSLEQGLVDIHRVLKPGGRFLAMEFSIPVTAWVRLLYQLYSFRVLPPAGKLICGTAAPFQYLAEPVRVFPDPDRIRLQLTELGFEGAVFDLLHNGLAVLYSGTKAD